MNTFRHVHGFLVIITYENKTASVRRASDNSKTNAGVVGKLVNNVY